MNHLKYGDFNWICGMFWEIQEYGFIKDSTNTLQNYIFSIYLSYTILNDLFLHCAFHKIVWETYNIKHITSVYRWGNWCLAYTKASCIRLYKII